MKIYVYEASVSGFGPQILEWAPNARAKIILDQPDIIEAERRLKAVSPGSVFGPVELNEAESIRLSKLVK